MKRIFLAVVLVLLNFPLVGLASDAPKATTNKQKITLGAIVPLTGPLAFFGKDFIRAYELALEAEPAIKESIDVIWEDSAYDSKQALSAFNKLIAVDKANIVLSFGGPMLSALAPVAESKKIPFFATESETADCQGREYCSLFRNEADEWGMATWKALRKQGRKNIGIVKNQNQFLNTFVDAIVRTKSADETVTIVFDVPPDTSDFRTHVIQLRTAKFDALGVYLLPISHHGFLEALRNVNQRFSLFGVEEFLVKENNVGSEAMIDGTLVIAPATIESYRARFEAKYAHSAGFFYTPAFYDFLTLLHDTIKANHQLRGLDLVKAMHFSGKRSGVSGEFSAKRATNGVASYSFPIAIYKVSTSGVAVEQIINF